MTKEESANKFKQELAAAIENKKVAKINNLSIGSIKIVFHDINTPLEIKRFLHIFKQCDLNNCYQTCQLLNRAEFIKGIKFKYISSLSLIQNLKCFLIIQRMRLKIKFSSFISEGESVS